MEPAEPDPCCRCSCCCTPNRSDDHDLIPVDVVEQAGGEHETLRETVESLQQTVQDLCEELDEERNAASSAASETMSMILRLQREKAELQMEARQFKRFAEEKFEHDQLEIDELEEELCKREETIEVLEREIRELRERDERSYIETEDVPKSSMSGDIDRIELVEHDGGDVEMLEVSCECRDGSGVREEASVPAELVPVGGDDSSDRVYTIDMVHGVSGRSMDGGVCEGGSGGEREIDVVELSRRVQALEEDREKMRQAVVNMKAESTQLVLLREISQNLCKVMIQPMWGTASRRQLVEERSSAGGFSFLQMFKWLVSFLFFWKRKPKPTQPKLPGRNACGSSSSNNVGLYLLLGNSPLFRQLRSLPRKRGQGFS